VDLVECFLHPYVPPFKFCFHYFSIYDVARVQPLPFFLFPGPFSPPHPSRYVTQQLRQSPPFSSENFHLWHDKTVGVIRPSFFFLVFFVLPTGFGNVVSSPKEAYALCSLHTVLVAYAPPHFFVFFYFFPPLICTNIFFPSQSHSFGYCRTWFGYLEPYSFGSFFFLLPSCNFRLAVTVSFFRFSLSFWIIFLSSCVCISFLPGSTFFSPR